MVNIMIKYKDDDGAAWIEGDTIVINVKWINIEEEVEWYIDESFIHEYIEHVLGLGHEVAVYVEQVLRRLLYREWFGKHPALILYSSEKSKTPRVSHVSRPSSSVRPVREAHQQFLSLHRGVQVPP